MIIDLDALEQAARSATPGPWIETEPGCIAGCGNSDLADTWFIQDSRYIALANPATVLALIAALREAQRRVDD